MDCSMERNFIVHTNVYCRILNSGAFRAADLSSFNWGTFGASAFRGVFDHRWMFLPPKYPFSDYDVKGARLNNDIDEG